MSKKDSKFQMRRNYQSRSFGLSTFCTYNCIKRYWGRLEINSVKKETRSIDISTIPYTIQYTIYTILGHF